MALRLGVDVGGTFTDVVAVDAQTLALVARIKIPTTHGAPGGVAEGIIDGIRRVMREHHIAAQDVAFIAHSTTQATNALLEGDVARVGVVGLLRHAGWIARAQMRFKPFDLAPGRPFAPVFAFTRATGGDIDAALDALASSGVTAIAASEPFSVDRPEGECAAVSAARQRGLPATSGHEVTSMYGLRARTRTAALNAAILPTMLRTAEMTRDAVKDAQIAAPLMVMRSDGGVMSVDEMMSRPILTMLSGPAAGVAGALLYENVTDGIFLEVGGTSVDCSAIRGGRPQMRHARVGGMRTMLTTIDSRTLGVAGGSMPRVDAHGIVAVGPRSAHIAGCRYAAFCTPEELRGAAVERFAPRPGDPADYVRLRLRDGGFATVTPTCASNLLGYVPAAAFSFGDAAAAESAFAAIARELGGEARAHARAMLEQAAKTVQPCIDALIGEYELPRERTVLVGGGGGAAALVPFIAERFHFQHRIAKDAEVISPIGVALALVRDVVERTIADPQPADILSIRREAYDRALRSGAAPDRIELSVEIDAQRSLVRAIASGATALTQSSQPAAIRVEESGRSVHLIDERDVVRLTLDEASITRVTAGTLEDALPGVIEAATAFGDVGRSLPDVYLVRGGRIADLRGIAAASTIVALAKEEIAGVAAGDPLVIVTVRRAA